MFGSRIDLGSHMQSIVCMGLVETQLACLGDLKLGLSCFGVITYILIDLLLACLPPKFPG